MDLKKTVSAAVIRKNQTNAKKSTGPTSAEGKNRSRFNATKHGLTAKRIMYNSNGTPIENGVAEIAAALREQCGDGSVIKELLIDNIAADYWRQDKGLEAEVRYLSRDDWAFHPQGSLATIQRYNVANRRALLKNIELLQEAHAGNSGTTALKAVPNSTEDNETGAEGDESAPSVLGGHMHEHFTDTIPHINDDGEGSQLTDKKLDDVG